MMKSGFTLPELIVTVGLFLGLVSLLSINLLATQHSASLNSQITTLLADIKSQQLKSMLGFVGGDSTVETAGVHFEADSYTLFDGSYSVSDSENTIVSLGSNLSFSNIDLSGSDIIFTRGSGEVVGYSATDSTFSLVHVLEGKSADFSVNPYGIVTQTN